MKFWALRKKGAKDRWYREDGFVSKVPTLYEHNEFYPGHILLDGFDLVRVHFNIEEVEERDD